MLINRRSDIIRLFGGLKYVIIDEIHTLMGVDRGNQILCQLDRIREIIGYHPRRIGLSATIGDPEKARDWLTGGTGRRTQIPSAGAGKSRWRLALEHFYVQDNTKDRDVSAAEQPEEKVEIDAGYEYLYDCVKDKKKHRFFQFARGDGIRHRHAATNRRAQSGGRHLLYPSRKSFRRDPRGGRAKAEGRKEMRGLRHRHAGARHRHRQNRANPEHGRTEHRVELPARLGRSGRKTGIPEMFMIFREEKPLPDTPLPQLIPWELVRGIARRRTLSRRKIHRASVHQKNADESYVSADVKHSRLLR